MMTITNGGDNDERLVSVLFMEPRQLCWVEEMERRGFGLKI